MSFVWPSFLWLMLLLPLVIWLLWMAGIRRTRTAQAFADAHLLGTVVRPAPKLHQRLPLILQLLALAALLFSASRPIASPPLPVNKAAVVIALDSSKSMLGNDIIPTRLEAAKALAREFIKAAPPTTQIGLASFSDSASMLVLPTTDRQELLDALDRVKPSQNTSLPSAVVTGVRMLPGRRDLKSPPELLPQGLAPDFSDPLAQLQPDVQKPQPERDAPPGSILILSDGVSNVSTNPGLPTLDALEIAAKFARDNKVKLYTFPVGREGGTVMRIDNQDVFVPFEPRTLAQLAQRTDGKNTYPPTPEALKAVFKEMSTIIRWEPTRLEISYLLSGFAIILMLLAGGLNLRWQRRVP